MNGTIPTEDINRFETAEEAFQYIRYAGTLPDDDLDIAETALALALVFLPGILPDRFRHHLQKLQHQLSEEFMLLLRTEKEDTLSLRLKALQQVIHDKNGYKGSIENYDDIQNGSLIRMIDRKYGWPVTLGILYMILSKHMHWDVWGVQFPGNFLLRMERDGERILIDPFQNGKVMEASDLRHLLKSIAGETAELSHNFYDIVSDRDVLIRLQNNLKTRFIDLEDYAQAVIVIEMMEALAPEEYRISFDKGILYAKLGQGAQAIRALEEYMAKTPDIREKEQARELIQQIRLLENK